MAEIVLFDLPTLVAGEEIAGDTEEQLRELLCPRDDLRRGVLCNLTAGEGPAEVSSWLKALALDDSFDPGLLLVPSAFGYTLPDAAAFRIAAAAVGVEPAALTFVSADRDAVAGAEAAGLATVDLSSGVARPGLLAEVDPDGGMSYMLRGRVVSMTAEDAVLDDGLVAVKGGRIAAVLPADEDLPGELVDLPQIETAGTIYPGLIDLHNHLAYNVLPLWVVPKKYENRSQWPRHREYRARVSKPINDALACYTPTAQAIARFVECRALMSGTTTGQGLRTRRRGIQKLMRGAMRNIEETEDLELPESRSKVPDLGRSFDQIASFRRALNETERRGSRYFYHLSEGVDESARRHFFNLANNDLLTSSLVGIHSLGLQRQDLQQLADAQAKIVWSPFSNLLLYGQTLDLDAVLETGVQIALGCDWSPTGSKNLLQELKVADFEIFRQKAPISAFELVRMVTAGAAEIVGWSGALGTLAAGQMADLVVIEGTDKDPYRQLIEAQDHEVSLVAVHGRVRFGTPEFVEELHEGSRNEREAIAVNGVNKLLAVQYEGSPISHVSLAKAVETLTIAMSDLQAHIEEQEERGTRLMVDGVPEPQTFVIDLDNEFELFEDELLDFEEEAQLLDDPGMAPSIELERIHIDPFETNYWSRIDLQDNLPDGLNTHLKRAYGVISDAD